MRPTTEAKFRCTFATNMDSPTLPRKLPALLITTPRTTTCDIQTQVSRDERSRWHHPKHFRKNASRRPWIAYVMLKITNVGTPSMHSWLMLYWIQSCWGCNFPSSIQIEANKRFLEMRCYSLYKHRRNFVFSTLPIVCCMNKWASLWYSKMPVRKPDVKSRRTFLRVQSCAWWN